MLNILLKGKTGRMIMDYTCQDLSFIGLL